MFNGSEIFEKHYHDYCDQIAKVDFLSIKDKLGIEYDEDQILIQFINNEYRISRNGITDTSGNRPGYVVCVILSKYILLCPDQVHHDTEWVSFKEFERASHFTNANFLISDTKQVIIKHFSGKLDKLFAASEELGGFQHKADMPYDLAMQFDVLPRVSLLLLYNDRDEEFSANCTVLFQKHAEFYLDPESLVMTSGFLAKSLRKADQLIQKTEHRY